MTSGSRPVVVSAHLDDAVLSAAAQILRPGARVVTLFAGAPPPGVAGGPWDRLTGAVDAAARVHERWLEDDAALDIAGVPRSRLAMLDEQHRDPRPPDHDGLAGALAEPVEGATEIWLPAAVGGHPDHVATRQAGMQAAELTTGRPEVHLYADVPYAVHYGWPPSVTGRPVTSPYLDVEAWLAQELLVGGLGPHLPPPTVHNLDERTRRRKVAMVACYRTQLPALDPSGRLASGDPALLGFELSWGPL